MGTEVYANMMAVSCKAASGKSICAFPDVALTPPSPPIGPIPIPYPNTAMASDTTDGTKTVKIAGQEVGMKNLSCFKQSSGDEAATKSMGMGVVTATIQGKAYYINYSMDVKVEGANVPRHLDLMTHNHMGPSPGNTPPWPYIDTMAVAVPIVAATETQTAESPPDECERDPKPECQLVPYKDGCPKGKTPHHAIPVHCFMGKGARSLPKEQRQAAKYEGCKNYSMNDAPCVCVDGKSKTGTHGKVHDVFDKLEDSHLESRRPRKAGSWTYEEAKEAAVKSLTEVDLGEGKKCSAPCMEKQIREYHESEKVGIGDGTALRADSSGRGTSASFRPAVSEPGAGF